MLNHQIRSKTSCLEAFNAFNLSLRQKYDLPSSCVRDPALRTSKCSPNKQCSGSTCGFCLEIGWDRVYHGLSQSIVMVMSKWCFGALENSKNVHAQHASRAKHPTGPSRDGRGGIRPDCAVGVSDPAILAEEWGTVADVCSLQNS